MAPNISSGGLKTIANFGFYLAQLQVRLRGYPTYLPPFMVIDSPRKNFGSNEADAESMRRFYRTLWALRPDFRSSFWVLGVKICF
jgi:hypothetical protein